MQKSWISSSPGSTDAIAVSLVFINSRFTVPKKQRQFLKNACALHIKLIQNWCKGLPGSNIFANQLYISFLTSFEAASFHFDISRFWVERFYLPNIWSFQAL